MSLSGAAAAMGLPEALVQRSAEARAAETGASVDDILASWAGGETVEAGAPAEPEPVTEDAPTEEPQAEEEAPTTMEPREPAATPEPAAAPAVTPTRAPVPTEVTASEAAHLPEVITVPTAGIREKTNFVIPRWLTGLLLIAPLLALFALGGSATGACGEATELRTDIITGAIVNCDGSEFTGGGIDGGTADLIALGGEIYAGQAVSGVNCAGCHGADGQGTSAFPPLTGVLTTFGACADHVEWVTLGSTGFVERGSYGDTNKPLQMGMPAFAGSLTEEQLAAVSAFERVRFNGADSEETLVDCGLAEAEDVVDGNGEDGEADEEDGPAEDEEGMEAAAGAGH